MFLLTKTALGRYIYAVGNQEQAVFLSGVRTQWVLVGGFVASGVCAAVTGMLLAGYSHKAYQAMGDGYLMSAIAAVVIGGTNIMGGRGTYLGTVLGTILIVLLQSVLSIMQMPDAGRQIIYGGVIIAMLLVYGRQEGHTCLRRNKELTMNRTKLEHEIKPTPTEVECVLSAKATIGEGPSWSVKDQLLYWADIPEKKLHIFNPKDGSNKTFELPDLVTCVSPRKNGGLGPHAAQHASSSSIRDR